MVTDSLEVRLKTLYQSIAIFIKTAKKRAAAWVVVSALSFPVCTHMSCLPRLTPCLHVYERKGLMVFNSPAVLNVSPTHGLTLQHCTENLRLPSQHLREPVQVRLLLTLPDVLSGLLSVSAGLSSCACFRLLVSIFTTDALFAVWHHSWPYFLDLAWPLAAATLNPLSY